MVSTLKDGKDLAEFCIDYGTKLGGSYVEIRYEKQWATSLTYRNGQPVSGGYTPTSGIGVRILVDGNIGFSSFDRLDKELAEESITAAFKMAKNAKRKEPIDLGEPVSNETRWILLLK